MIVETSSKSRYNAAPLGRRSTTRRSSSASCGMWAYGYVHAVDGADDHEPRIDKPPVAHRLARLRQVAGCEGLLLEHTLQLPPLEQLVPGASIARISVSDTTSPRPAGTPCSSKVATTRRWAGADVGSPTATCAAGAAGAANRKPRMARIRPLTAARLRGTPREFTVLEVATRAAHPRSAANHGGEP